MTINLIEKCKINTPGGIPIKENSIQVKLSTQYPIGRLAFTFNSPTVINESSDLVFSFKTSTPEFINTDILLGDTGFPEIHVENIEGETFRFKRGNIKDFINFRSIEEQQELRLPYSSFLYHIDLANNKKSPNTFFSIPISKINFDFLNNKKSEIHIEIENPRFEESIKSNMDAMGLLNIESVNKSKSMPLFVTESASNSVAISKNSICSTIYPDDLTLKWKITSQDLTQVNGEEILSRSKKYIELPITKNGASSLQITISKNSKILANTTGSMVRMLPRSGHPTDILGVSDEYCFDEINSLGGKFRRIVINMSSVIRENGSFRFSHNNNPFELLNGRSDEKYIVALKGMPKWLSNSKSPGDTHRYGPSNLDNYRELISWLINNLSKKGIYALESWNEANVIHEWNDSFTLLKEMQRILWDLVCQAGKPFLVLSPSSTSWDFSFFSKLLELGIYDLCDGLAMHAYTYKPEQHHELFGELEKITTLAAKGRVNFSCFITEVGFRTPSFSDHDQAAYLTLFTLQVFFRHRFSSIIWFRYRNSRPESLISYDQNASCGYAMVGYRDIYARPMLSSYRFLDNFLANCKADTILKCEDDTEFHGTTDNGKFIVSYSEKRVHSNITKEESSHLSFYDIYGNQIKIDSVCNHKIVFCTFNNQNA